jgi:hypothetical protein
MHTFAIITLLLAAVIGVIAFGFTAANGCLSVMGISTFAGYSHHNDHLYSLRNEGSCAPYLFGQCVIKGLYCAPWIIAAVCLPVTVMFIVAVTVFVKRS